MSNSGESQPRTNGSANILTLLAEMPTYPVEPERCLLVGVPVDRPMEEFFSEAAGGRTIALPTAGVDGRIHKKLAAKGLPVLRKFAKVEGLDLLRVPLGARTVGSVLHLIGEDVARFGRILRDAGNIQGQLMQKGMGVLSPTTRLGVLERLAIVPAVNRQDPRLVIIPPYDFEQVGASFFDHQVRHELAASGYFDDDQVHYLSEQTRLGMEDGYGSHAPGAVAA